MKTLLKKTRVAPVRITRPRSVCSSCRCPSPSLYKMEIYSSAKSRELFPKTKARFCFECASKAEPVAVEDLAHFRALRPQSSLSAFSTHYGRSTPDVQSCGTCGEPCSPKDLIGVNFWKRINSGSEIQVEVGLCRSCLGEIKSPSCYVAINKSRPGSFIRMDPD